MTAVPFDIREQLVGGIRAALIDAGRPDIAATVADDGHFGPQYINDADLIYRAHIIAAMGTGAVGSVPCFPCWSLVYRSRVDCPEVELRHALTLARHDA